jgi:SAM-dependent methyltransferase
MKTLQFQQSSDLNTSDLRRVAEFYDRAQLTVSWAGRSYRRVLAHYYRLMIPADASILELGCGSGDLLAMFPNRDITGIDVSEVQIERAKEQLPHGKFYVMAAENLDIDRQFDFIIISESINFFADAQRVFERLHQVARPGTRLLLNFHSRLWQPVLALAQALGLASDHPECSWFNWHDVSNLLWLSRWQVITRDMRILLPLRIPLFHTLLNRYLAPLLPPLCLTCFLVARSEQGKAAQDTSVSIVIPARNEAGNIEAAVRRIPHFGTKTEIIFVEGHSTDDTWNEILRVQRAYPNLDIRALQQTGKGKGNAVREAFDVATGNILMILDADLTMPPEDLPKFYRALVDNRAEVANGVRLVYPLEDQAMRFLNLCANRFFGISFSWLIGQPIKDTLCGTKVLYRDSYRLIAANRSYFGDFDPFGDFDLLFGASRLKLKIADVPIRYRQRTYGTTNIQRWRHGVLLLRMLMVAAMRLKFV